MRTDLIADDLSQFADRLETITHIRRGQNRGVTIQGAFRRAVPPRREDRDDGWSGADMVWHLPEQAVPGGVRPGDHLVDGAQRRWTVLVVSPTASGRIIAWTRDWSAAFSTGRTVDVERAEITRGDSGEAIPRWTTVAAGVPAEFVSCHCDRSETGTDRLPVYRVLVLWDGPQGRYRLKTDDGQYYSVLKVERPALLGHPTVFYVSPAPANHPT